MTYLPPANGGRINASIGGNVAGVATLISSGTMSLIGGNNVTLSQAGNVITIAGANGGGGGLNTLGMSNLGNTLGTSGVISGSALQFAFVGGNNVTLSQSINASSATISIAAASQTAQTQSNIQALYDGVNSVSTGTVRLSNANGVSFGLNGQTLTASHNAITSQSNQTVGLYAVSNTTQSTNATADARSLSFAGAGIASIGASNGSVLISVPAGGGGITNINLSAGTTSNNLSKVTFANSNGVSFGLNGSTMTASHNAITAQTNQTVGLYAVGNTTQNSSTSLDARTMSFNGLGAATMGYSNGSIQVSAPDVSSLVGTGAVSIATAGSTISIGAPAPATLSRFEYPNNAFSPLGAHGQGSLSMEHMYVPFYVSGSAMMMAASLSAGTATSATTASANLSFSMGIYTLNGSTLSLASSGTMNTNFQWSQSASTTANSSITGVRRLTVPMNVNLVPGEYWIGALISSQTTFTGATLSIMGNSMISASAAMAPIGSATSIAEDAILGQGMYSSTTGALPDSVPLSSINNGPTSNVLRANFYNVIFNVTY